VSGGFMQQVESAVGIEVTEEYGSILGILESASERYSDKVALVCDNQALTYRELYDLSFYFANYLKQEGLVEGDTIALVMPSILAYPITLFAAYRLNLTVVNVNPMFTPAEVNKVIIDCEPKAIVVFAPMIGNIISSPQFKQFKKVVSVVPGPIATNQFQKTHEGVADFNEALSVGSKVNGQHDSNQFNDVAFLQYTGGTTGQPKAAMLTHNNIITCIQQFHLMTDYIESGKEVVLAPLPLYHIFGMVIGLLSSLAKGSTVLLISDPRDISKMASLFKEWEITMMYGVNALYSGLYHAGNLSKKDLLSLKLCGSGATALSKDIAEKWKTLADCPIIEGYGMTETSGLISFVPDNKEAQFGTVGLSLPNCSTTIRDEIGNILPINTIGELCIKGPHVMSGYYNAPDATAMIFCSDGALKTGDIARIDENGYIWLVDRAKDMINVSGFNVYPNEVEQEINLFEGVLESACVSSKDDKSGEVVKAYIVCEDNKEVDVEALLLHCRERLTPYKIPKKVEIISALPKSPVGKILRKDLKK